MEISLKIIKIRELEYTVVHNLSIVSVLNVDRNNNTNKLVHPVISIHNLIHISHDFINHNIQPISNCAINNKDDSISCVYAILNFFA